MTSTIYRWLIGDMGTPGEYQYGAIHGYTVLAVVLVLAVFLTLGCRWRHDPRKSWKLLLAVAWFHLGFEVLWRLVYLFVKQDSILVWWPTYPCNLGGVLLPVIAITNWKQGKKMFYLFAFVGAVLTFALPEGIFCTDVLVFPVLKSILQHTGILLIPMLELVADTCRPTLKDMGWVTAGCLVHVANSEGFVRLLGMTEDYMFFRSGMPFVIPGVPQFITLSVFALLVLTALSFLCDIRGSAAFLRSLGKKKRIRS